MSWDCFCRAFGCPAARFGPTCSGQAIQGCGLSQYSILTVGGPYRWVYDGNGALVGEQISSDTGDYQCPSAPELGAHTVRAGQFPDTCNSSTVCQCSPDGGSCDPTDAGRI